MKKCACIWLIWVFKNTSFINLKWRNPAEFCGWRRDASGDIVEIVPDARGGLFSEALNLWLRWEEDETAFTPVSAGWHPDNDIYGRGTPSETRTTPSDTRTRPADTRTTPSETRTRPPTARTKPSGGGGSEGRRTRS